MLENTQAAAHKLHKRSAVLPEMTFIWRQHNLFKFEDIKEAYTHT